MLLAWIESLGAVSLGSGLAFPLVRCECLFASVNWNPTCCGALAVFPNVFWKAGEFWGRTLHFHKCNMILFSTVCLFGTKNSCGLLMNGKYASWSQRLAAYLARARGALRCMHIHTGWCWRARKCVGRLVVQEHCRKEKPWPNCATSNPLHMTVTSKLSFFSL